MWACTYAHAHAHAHTLCPSDMPEAWLGSIPNIDIPTKLNESTCYWQVVHSIDDSSCK